MKKTALILTALLSILFLHGCKLVVNNMAFHPDKKNVILTGQLPSNVQEIFIETEDRVKIQSYFIPDKSSNKILIYFHGNGGNICSRLPDLIRINNFGINVLGVSYRGYGKSQGEPSEEGIYTDGKAALTYAVQSLGFSVSNIIILGRSIGTAVAINTSQNLNIAGLILVSPLSSGKDMAKEMGLGWLSWIAGSSFDNLSKAKNIKSPVLIIHGEADEVIPINLGEKVYNALPVSEKKFIKVQRAGHNDIIQVAGKSFWSWVNHFIYMGP